MEYVYKILTDGDFYESFRTLLGVTEEEFTTVEIDMLPIMPAAEREVIRLIPAYQTAMEDPDLVYDLHLAVLYLAAVNALPSLRFKLLEIESDNKTTAQRFRSAINQETNYQTKANQYLETLKNALAIAAADDKVLFEISTPSIDIITGNSI